MPPPVISGRTTTGAAAWPVRRPSAPALSRRAAGLAILAAAVAAFMAYMVANVPIVGPTLTRAQAHSQWHAAVIAAMVVLAVGSLVVWGSRRIARAPWRVAAASAASGTQPETGVPPLLSWQHVPRWGVIASALLSATGCVVAAALGVHLWVGGLMVLAPWIPAVVAEVSWKHAHYGVLAAFGMLVVLQVLHMGEHSTQVGQLLASRGDLATSHGVFGQLDFELVHFVTDTTLWLTLGVLLVFFYSANKWLWVAFIAASLHQVEHLYLFWLYNFHRPLYEAGGFAGIMGSGGVIGSPLDRPYLHFSYNFIVVVPMCIALWDQAKRARNPARD